MQAMFEQLVKCRKCGNEQKTTATTGFVCHKCRTFFDLRGTQKKARMFDQPNRVGRLAGYCDSCGLMRMKSERKCSRCGSDGVKADTPRPSSLYLRMVNEVDRFMRATIVK
jgi:hypothetical protein